MRRFKRAWTAERIPGGYVVKDATGQALARVYASVRRLSFWFYFLRWGARGHVVLCRAIRLKIARSRLLLRLRSYPRLRVPRRRREVSR